jgi:hypothetical protein
VVNRLALLRVNLVHTDKKPRTTVIAINGHPMFEIRTFSSDLRFLQDKINKSDGKATDSAEYWFEIDETGAE